LIVNIDCRFDLANENDQDILFHLSSAFSPGTFSSTTEAGIELPQPSIIKAKISAYLKPVYDHFLQIHQQLSSSSCDKSSFPFGSTDSQINDWEHEIYVLSSLLYNCSTSTHYIMKKRLVSTECLNTMLKNSNNNVFSASPIDYMDQLCNKTDDTQPTYHMFCSSILTYLHHEEALFAPSLKKLLQFAILIASSNAVVERGFSSMGYIKK